MLIIQHDLSLKNDINSSLQKEQRNQVHTFERGFITLLIYPTEVNRLKKEGRKMITST